MNSILIISPNFPPVNAPDMHRVRHNVNFLEDLGWMPTVVCVEEKYNESSIDPILIDTVPKNIKVVKVSAFPANITRKIGLGALALRSLLFYFFKVNQLLKTTKFDLIFFSTTQFPVLILGRYWNWKYKVPYIIDMQDPWHSEYYKTRPKNEHPPKYWFSYHLNRILEPIAMKKAAGIISVSKGYCEQLQGRYKNITPNNCTVIPFGAFEKDFEISKSLNYVNLPNSTSKLQMLYIGRGGIDMQLSLKIIFRAWLLGLKKHSDLFNKIEWQCIGTSYAPGTLGTPSIVPIAMEFGLDEYIMEQTERIPYFDSITRLQSADLLLIPGSIDPNYTASKIYPYILSKKPILAVFSETSSIIEVLKNTEAGDYVSFNPSNYNIEDLALQLYEKWLNIIQKLPYSPPTKWQNFEKYTAREMTKKQVVFFEKILNS
ncbi:MAG: glycosyltransferase [Bacteroidota bacterium]|nr:glycosyltransferase [Bacteroidota bacterium]